MDEVDPSLLELRVKLDTSDVDSDLYLVFRDRGFE